MSHHSIFLHVPIIHLTRVIKYYHGRFVVSRANSTPLLVLLHAFYCKQTPINSLNLVRLPTPLQISRSCRRRSVCTVGRDPPAPGNPKFWLEDRGSSYWFWNRPFWNSIFELPRESVLTGARNWIFSELRSTLLKNLKKCARNLPCFLRHFL